MLGGSDLTVGPLYGVGLEDVDGLAVGESDRVGTLVGL